MMGIFQEPTKYVGAIVSFDNMSLKSISCDGHKKRARITMHGNDNFVLFVKKKIFLRADTCRFLP